MFISGKVATARAAAACSTIMVITAENFLLRVI
jgi:hypothetical protein